MIGDVSDETSCSAYQSGRCDFEHGLCLYSQSYDDKFDWTVSAAGTYSFGTGPTVDHTTRSKKGIDVVPLSALTVMIKSSVTNYQV